MKKEVLKMAEKKFQILLIGKDEGLNEILALALERRGFEVSCARMGKDVLNAVKDNCPDIIIFDIAKWGIEEMETHQEVKTNKVLDGAPVIFCLPEHVQEIVPYKKAHDRYLRKPFEFKELYEEINKIISFPDRQS